MELYSLILGLIVFQIWDSHRVKKVTNTDLSNLEKMNELLDSVQSQYGTLVIPRALLAAMIYVESGFNPNAVGDNGKAFGLMQLTYPAYVDSGCTADWEFVKKDPFYNVLAGVKYLAWIDGFLSKNGHKPTVNDVIIAYNIGVGNFLRGEKLQEGKRYLEKILKKRRELIQKGL